ncbi:VanZ family protein [Paenibacillus sp. FSL L8-0436]|uniref:VanZ family protein n=1 Tax=Paenibacillus sp. FSL L8-0436 TaxID=2954686 RepID=UPI0031587C10
METKWRKFISAGTILYTILILYFIFFAFNRLENATGQSGYTFILVPETIPLRFPKLTFSWVYDFGNIAAFIPFGVLFPLLYRVRFRKFISLFVLAILVLETLQALTYLGSFDVDDVISNTLGGAIGFFAYKVGFSPKITYKKLMAAALSVVLFFVGIIIISETVNYALVKQEGPIRALHELKEVTGNIPMTGNLPTFTVAGKRIEPEFNIYSSDGDKDKKYTYILGNKIDVKFYSNYGIQDNGDSKGAVTVMADGNMVAQYNDEYSKEAEPLEIPFDTINEITIIVSGNAKLWDVGITEMKHWWE